MAVLQRGEADFEADGVRWRLVVDFAAFAEAEDVSGLAVDALMQALQPATDGAGKIVRTPRLKHLGALFYGALTAHHPDITPREALNLLGNNPQGGEALGKAMVAAMPKPDESTEGKAPAARGTGTKPRPTGRHKA